MTTNFNAKCLALMTYGGYTAGQTYTLNQTVYGPLVAQGVLRVVDGQPFQDPYLTQSGTFATDSTGAVTGLVLPNGNPALKGKLNNLAKPAANWFGSIEFATLTTGTISNTTWESRRSVPFPFMGGRAVSYNSGAVPAANNIQYCVAVAPDAATTASTGFKTITWNGGKTSPVSLFQGTAAGQLEMAVSDPFIIDSIPRTDGGAGYIASMRGYANGAITYAVAIGVTAGQQLLGLDTDGVLITHAGQAGDFVNTPAGYPLGYSAGSNLILGDLILFSDTTVVTVAQGGDSVAQGSYSIRGRDNDLRLACNYLTVNGIANCYYSNRCAPGTTSDLYGYNSIEFVQKIKPHIFFYTPETSNDGTPISAVIGRQRTFLYALLKACQDSGTTLVVCTMAPWWVTGYSATDDNTTKALNATLATFASNAGLTLYDRYSMLTDGTSPAHMKSAYAYSGGAAGSGANAHPTDAGYIAMMPTAAAAIRALIGK